MSMKFESYNAVELLLETVCLFATSFWVTSLPKCSSTFISRRICTYTLIRTVGSSFKRSLSNEFKTEPVGKVGNRVKGANE